MNLPTFIDPELWEAFCEMRRSMGKRAPFTEYAKLLIIKQLIKFDADGYDANSSLKQSIMRGWRGVFEAETKAQTRQDAATMTRMAQEKAREGTKPPSDDVRRQLAELTKKLKGAA